MTGRQDDPLRPIEEARRSLYARLRALPPAALTARPAAGGWSPLEDTRHLLYAERKHLARLLPKGFPWSPIGLPTGGTPRRSGAGTVSSDDLDEVLAAWDTVHAAVRLDSVERTDAERAVARNLHHLLNHIRHIERTLSERGG